MNRLEIQNIMRTIKYKNWEFFVGTDDSRMYLQLQWQGYCTDTNVMARQTSRKWFLSEHMTKSELVQTAFKAVLTAEEHEVRELFTYKDKAIFGPHFDIDVLHSCQGMTDKRKPKDECDNCKYVYHDPNITLTKSCSCSCHKILG